MTKQKPQGYRRFPKWIPESINKVNENHSCKSALRRYASQLLRDDSQISNASPKDAKCIAHLSNDWIQTVSLFERTARIHHQGPGCRLRSPRYQREANKNSLYAPLDNKPRVDREVWRRGDGGRRAL